MSLSKLQEMVNDREAWHAAVHGVTKSQTIPGWRKCPGEGNGGRSEDPAVLLVQNLGLNWSYSGSDQQTGIISITWWLVRNAES